MNLKKQLLLICLLWLFTLPMVAFGKPLLSTSDTTRTKPNQLGIIPKATRTIDKEVMGHYRSFPELSDFVNQMQLETQTKTVVSGNPTVQSDILHIPMQQSIAEFTDEYIKSIYFRLKVWKV